MEKIFIRSQRGLDPEGNRERDGKILFVNNSFENIII
jgi:hypothetical protein